MSKRIGFIAMSGVRAHNAELTELGLTLPGFVERNKIIASMPSLGLLTLAALTPEQFEVGYLEIADVKEEPEPPLDFDLVAISTFSAQIFEAYTIADYYRANGIKVVMGGLHVTTMPDEAAEHADAVVIGEGELTWPALLRDFERGELKARYRPDPGEEFDLADAPMPRYDLLDPDKYNRLTIQTSRGCPHRCSFCASSILLTPKYKLKPVERVIEEIHEIKKIWERPFIEFADDNSFVHRRHYKSLLRAMIPEKLRWFTEADVSVARDPEMLALMRDAGCQQVLIGLESPDDASLQGVELKADWKLRQRDRYLEAIELIQSHGITVNGTFIFGLDGDTPEVFGRVLDYVRAANLYEIQVTKLTAFPGTPLYAQLKQEGRILRDGAWELCTLFDTNFVPRNMTVEELDHGFVELVRVLYSDEETQARRRKFREMIRHSPNARRKRARNETGWGKTGELAESA